jgi:hypothetical protein
LLDSSVSFVSWSATLTSLAFFIGNCSETEVSEQLYYFRRNNMDNIEAGGKRFGLTRGQFCFFLGVSTLWFAYCFALLIPPIRNLIIGFGEALIRRPLNHTVWHRRFTAYSIGGIGLFIFCFWTFFSVHMSPAATGKKTDIFIIIISLMFVFIIMYKANWVFGDDHEYISTTVINKYVPHISGEGRFAPFKYIHYNLPLFIFRCLGINTGLPVEAHFAVNSIFYIVTLFCLYFLLNGTDPVKTAGAHSSFNRFFACAFFLLGSSFSYAFLSLIFPETPVIMLFSVFTLMYYKALKTGKIQYYAAALLSAVYSTYCKEPVFGVFLVIAFVNYLFRKNKKSKLEKLFYTALAANGILFIILYYFLSFKNTAGFYNEGRVLIRGFGFFLSIFKGSPVLIIMFGFGLIRLYSVIVRKERDYLFYDSLLFAGIAYALAYFVLHLNEGYYFLPSLILFLPSLAHWTEYLFEKKRAFAAALFIILLPLYLNNSGQTAEWIWDIWRERQKFIPYVTNLLSDHNNGMEFIWYESDDRIDDTFFTIARIRNDKKFIENKFLNYVNKSEGIDFFFTEKSADHVTLNQNILFFYPLDNDKNQPMRDELAKILRDNNFRLYKDSYGILIYKRH